MSESIEPKRNLRLALGLSAFMVALVGLALFVVKVYLAPKPSPFLTEGFDFNLLRSPDIEWRGPSIGEKLDLTSLETREGQTLASIVDKRPIMLVALSPDCGMCGIATDEMLQLRDGLANKNLNYYMSFFNSRTPNADTFKYADGLNIGVRSVIWNKASGQPPEPIFKMTTPSHLLLKSDGTVIRVWPGSYAEKSVRDRMARQILSDTSVILDTLDAVAQDGQGH